MNVTANHARTAGLVKTWRTNINVNAFLDTLVPTVIQVGEIP